METDSRKKILWVEDDAFLEGLVAHRLNKEAYVLLHAENGETALALAKSEHPNIVLLDILLPGMDGIEILQKLKEDPATKNIPVLMFSNINDPEKMQQAKKLGAVKFFVKAFVTLDDILAEIQKVVAPV